MSKSRRVLDPLERSSEALFGLIMALTFTCSLSVGSAGHEEVRTMLIGALGCNLAWGLVDAAMYLLSTLITQARGVKVLKAMRAAADPATGQRILADALPPVVASVIRPAELESMYWKLLESPALPARILPRGEDLRGALGVFLLVFLTTFPVVVPFLLFQEPQRALRISNAVAVLMLFLAGHRLGKYSSYHPIRFGLAMVAVGCVLVGVTIALGG